jgi:hypothetical protein
LADSSDHSVWFIGDLSDPWVVSIAESLSRCTGIVQVHCPADLPDRPFEADRPPPLIVIHRHRFTPVDAQRLKEYRSALVSGEPPVVLLCISPYVRYEELERWSLLADLVISEATAADVLPRHAIRLVGAAGKEPPTLPDAARVRIEVAGGNHDLCQAVVDACTGAGYQTLRVADLEITGAVGARNSPSRPSAGHTLTIWDVPLLEPDWSQRLARRAHASGPVIALVGFPDRQIVTVAKASGAFACLELPFNVDDLIDVIDRATRTFSPDRSSVPTRVEQPHHLPPPPRRRRQQRELPAASAPWSDRQGKPRVS